MTQKERLRKRNIKIKQTYKDMLTKHPQWRYKAIINDVSDKFFLAPRTIEAILRGEGKTYS